MFFLPAIIASLGVAQAAVVTVTQHVHEDAIVSVQGVLYIENGETRTTFITEGAATPTPISNQISTTVIAVAGTSGNAIDTAELEKAMTTGAASASITGSSSGTSSSGSQTTLAPSTASAIPSSLTTSAVASTSSAVASTSSAVASTSSAEASTSSAVASTSSAVASTSSAVASTSSTVASTSSTVASTSSAASSPVPSSSSSTFEGSMVNGHNSKRALHQSTSSLEWDDTLATYAQNYADEYDCSGSLKHSGGPYGENLAVGFDDQGTIDAWYNEISKYDWSNPNFSEATGHFTQVVWKSSTKVGCGYKQCGGSVGKYVICSYSSAGNIIGYFSENVFPLL